MPRRRISIRKIIQTLVTLVVVTGFALAMISADRRQRRHMVRDVQVQVLGRDGVKFLTEDAIRNTLFTARHVNPYKQSVSSLDERSMEAILRTNPWVQEAQVYTDAEWVMHVTLTQRVPVVRLFEEDGNSYYLDTALQTMPLSGQYTHYTPVVTGVPHLQNDSAATDVKGTIVGLIQQISRHPLWNAQISQVDMRADGGFEIIPVMGMQRIIIGDTARLGEKLNNLFAFYKQVHNKIGWDKYKMIDLRYKGQVVASPALAWKAPVDHAISTMSWLTAIMESAPVHNDVPGGDAVAFSDSVATVIIPKPQATVPASKSQPPPIVPNSQFSTVMAKPVQTGTARTDITSSSSAHPKPKPKLPSDVMKKKDTEPPVKNTPRYNQNTKSNAATIR